MPGNKEHPVRFPGFASVGGDPTTGYSRVLPKQAGGLDPPCDAKDLDSGILLSDVGGDGSCSICLAAADCSRALAIAHALLHSTQVRNCVNA
jgi:hypothetical protein